MVDFHDRLSHPFASVAIGEFKTGRFEEAQQLYEKAVSTYRDGFQGAYLLREPDSDRGMSVIFWETQAAMDASKGEIHDAILRQMNPLFAARPLLDNYEIACSVQSNDMDLAH
ncbi:MAG: antibiotic biosynthesis monooxygenase [Cyanobacteria bacterium P01_E01_bin.34]